jgi:anti-sigma B factor antagonist
VARPLGGVSGAGAIAMAGLRAETARVGGAPALAFHGEVDLATAGLLRERIEETILESEGALVLDLSGVEFLDSSGIAALLRARAVLGREDRSLILVCPEGPVRRVLALTGAEELFVLTETRAAAARRLRPARPARRPATRPARP